MDDFIIFNCKSIKKMHKKKLQIIENGQANCESSFLSKKIISFQRSDNFVQLSCIYTLKLHSRFLICAKKHNFTHTYLQRHKRVYNHVYISLMQENHTSFMNLHRGIENMFFFFHFTSVQINMYMCDDISVTCKYYSKCHQTQRKVILSLLILFAFCFMHFITLAILFLI